MSKHHILQSLTFDQENMILTVDGSTYHIPIDRASKRLAQATEAERKLYEISPSGYGIHWFTIDGSLTADLERFMPWRTIDGERIAPKGTPEMQVLIEGVFAKQRLLDLVQNFIVFGDTGSGIYKIIAGYHQFRA